MRIAVRGKALALISFLAAGPAPAADLHVSPGGSDAGPGTVDRPFATLARARDAARALAGREPVRILLRGGIHYLPEPLVLGPQDSGTEAAPVSWEAYGDEKPVVSGGARLRLAWEPWRDGILKARVPPDLETDGLFIDGEALRLARYPNFDAKEPRWNGYAPDAIAPERVARWKDPRGGFVHAIHAFEWGGMHYRILGKNPDGTLALEGGWQNNRPAGMHPRYRMVENILEELDAPGEWFLDRGEHILYVCPPAGGDLSRATVEAARLRHLVELRGEPSAPVRFVQLKRLTFRHTIRTFLENREPLVRSDWTTYRGGAIFLTGAEDCSIEDCAIEGAGGNAVFASGYNRRLTVRGCHIVGAGANGVAFVGDRGAARVPRDWNDRSQNLSNLDRTPGPRTEDYPADCLVEDCLIHATGRIEKQTAPVQIELARRITVRHCSLYDVPRAGINIGDGCWGGHAIEFCDIFDTVKETGDHGSFNSWGRDRFWGLDGLDLNEDAAWESRRYLPLLDAMETTVLRNNRWRCDHGWDIDLDDGSTNYIIRDNLCLRGGIKNREGFYRVVENNVIVGSGFHPHVWFKHSEDVVRRNIFWSEEYLPAGGMPATPWGKEMDLNLVHRPGVAEPEPAERLAAQSGRDRESIVADARFVDPASGDYRVRDDSPALKLGFANFPMDRFGVRKPALRAIARTPELPRPGVPAATGGGRVARRRTAWIGGARVRDIAGLGDRSAYGLPRESGVLMLEVPEGSPAAAAGLRKDDVILGAGGQPVGTIGDLRAARDAAAGKAVVLAVRRKQGDIAAEWVDPVFAAVERGAKAADLRGIPPAPAGEAIPARVEAGEPGTLNEPLPTLLDGQLERNYGPVFGNGVLTGAYRLDLGARRPVGRVRAFSWNQNGNRGRQRFVLYGSAAAGDPGWEVEDRRAYAPILDVDTGPVEGELFLATEIRRADGSPLGEYRWLLWAVAPATAVAGGENTAFQEMQALAPPGR